MASQPPDLPDTIVAGVFKGIRNTIDRERLDIGDLARALNVDIDDAGQVHRRRGFTLRNSGKFHSVETMASGTTFGVKDGELGIINPDFSHTGLGMMVGDDVLDYAQVDRTTYFSSRSASGKVTGNIVDPWGAVDSEGTWISPVLTPTDTLGEVFGQMLNAPPMATDIDAYSGRIYLMAGRYIWFTELWRLDYVDRTKNFFQLEFDGTMLGAMNHGIYVGTTGGLYFIRDNPTQGMRIDKILDAPVVRGSMIRMPATEIHPNAQRAPMPEDTAIVFLTHDGVIAGFDNGDVYNLTRTRVVLPPAVNSAALYRQDRGVSSYLVTADSGGDAAINARIGDFIGADIIRAADRRG